MARPHTLQTKYSEEEIERGLRMLAVLNSAERASQQSGIPESTLTWWRRHIHADRYQRIRAEMLPRIQEEMAQQAEAAALEQGEVAMELLEQLKSRISEMRPVDAANALRNVETAKGINVDKTLVLRGQPNQIVEHRDTSQILDAIKRRFPSGVVDADSEDISDAEVDAEGPRHALSGES